MYAVFAESLPGQLVGEDVTAVGYGFTDFEGKNLGERRKAQLRIKAVEGQPYALAFGSLQGELSRAQ
jgi:hypothetical protein